MPSVRPMRRHDRQTTDREEIIQIMQACDVIRLGIKDDDGYPYIVPLNFGLEDRDGSLCIYLHSAMEGYKLDLLRMDPLVSFEMDTGHVLYSDRDRGYCTMNFQSVMGRGRIIFVEDPEAKAHDLSVMTDHYHMDHFPFNEAAIPRTQVLELRVDTSSLTGKQKRTRIPRDQSVSTGHSM